MPLQIKDIIDLQTLVESEQVEFKLAGGGKTAKASYRKTSGPPIPQWRMVGAVG
ncbi:Uncharacterised protein [Salmonella enterica subsp. arizonae]|uniref:Uncharacterized protein n=1 Tax=Salmonella enterica subsp. arizonae TaxID=59203 RepID=A0A379S9D7_SALER|nr:Uncharacterised protein [Salmonella enterica subsp. arizonae]SUG40013.1 Uncharacterised protein [Salmonella enterica subsp. arizonae]